MVDPDRWRPTKYKYSVKFKMKCLEHTSFIHDFTSSAGILLFEPSFKAV